MIFHKWKLLFIGIPKNASVSIHNTLINKTDDFKHRHRGIIEEFNENDEGILMSYTSFCVARNPYDRFYSAWKHNHPHPGPISIETFKQSFNDFVRKVAKPGNAGVDISHHHYWPQYKFVTVNRRIVVDKVLSFENLTVDWQNFQNEWNVTKTHLPYKMKMELIKLNSSEITTRWEEIYNQESLRIIQDLYQLDFEIFNYKL